MKKWLFVLAYNKDPDDPLCFKHCFVEAETEDEAYTLGQRQLVDATMAEPETTSLENDYVVELP